MEFRGFREGDFEALYALDRVCFAPPFRFSRAIMRRVVRSAGAVVLLAWERGAAGEEVLAGFCAVEVEREGGEVFGYVATLDVAPARRRVGLGRRLMEQVEGMAAAKDATVMALHVFVGNAAAVQLYEGIGYARVGRDAGFYGRGLDAWVYQKGIASEVRLTADALPE